jgi:myo-inositol-1(or 4)-monophosphatase
MKLELDYSVIIESTQKVGEMLCRNFGNVNSLHSKSTSAADVVTYLDVQVEQFLSNILEKEYPEIGFVGEELGKRRSAKKLWIVDPIDGTSHFIRGIPFCTTMIALVDEGEVIFSIIYDFVRKDLYTAHKNAGAQLNGVPIHVSNRSLKEAYISAEIGLNQAKNVELFLLLNQRCKVLNTINNGFEFGLIASGKIDGRICVDPFGKDWDYAAGALLVSEAGGVVANISKKSYDYHDYNFLATNKMIYDELTSGHAPLFPCNSTAPIDLD